MTPVDLTQLIAKHDEVCRRSLEGAAGLCLSRTNYNVEIEHWLLKMLEADNTDLLAICRHYEIDLSRLTADLTRGIDRLKTGNARPPALSRDLIDLVKQAWLVCSIDFHGGLIRTGHVLCALVSDDSFSRVAASASGELTKISPESLRKNLLAITSETDEAASAARAASASSTSSGPQRPAKATKTPALDQYTIDLTERARNGEIDPVLGRDPEIRQVMDILMRRRQNNPILTGEAGVGKTAVVEGFAQRIAAGDVPPALQGATVRTLDMGLLQAGAGVKGEFENRLKSVIEEVKSSPSSIILFIDEAHTLIGAGGQAGQGDAANLLKPALARGELRTIAATTWAEYKKYFERDAALTRRFQVVKVEEPVEKTAVEMIRGLVTTLENHHQVRVLTEAVVEAVKLSSRYITGRQLPDKAVSLLDTTCARISLSQSATPPAIEDCQRRMEQSNVAIEALRREEVSGADHAEAVEELTTQRAKDEQELKSLQERWEKEKDLVGKISLISQRLEGVTKVPDAGKTSKSNDASKPQDSAAPVEKPVEKLTETERTELRAELAKIKTELLGLQGEQPLVHPCVNSAAVAETVAAWTGIPVGRMVANEVETVLNLKSLMEQAIVGQSHALELIAKSIRTSRANLTDPRVPIGVFLLAGPSGVGKTETAITLANLMYGGEQNMTVINMSEFKEEHKVSLLMGSPPGYVGYGEGGILTEAVRRKPYSVVLLDEMEKAHPGVQDIFYQVFDKGNMKDGEGRDIDFKNTIILMTTNAGSEVIKSLCSDPETAPEADALANAVFPEFLKTFKPAFLGRLTLVPYFPLTDPILKQIVELKLNKIGRRVRENYRARFSFTNALVKNIVERCTEVDTGARNVDKILNQNLLPELSADFLGRMASGKAISGVEVDSGEGNRFIYRFEE